MIDWLTMKLNILHRPIPAAQVIRLQPTGEIDYCIRSRTEVEGSFDNRVYVRSTGTLNERGECTELELSGNPAKYLQGHNIFGIDDLHALVPYFVFTVCDTLQLHLSALERRRIEKGDYQLSRVDITYSYQLPSRSECRAFTRALDHKARTRRGKGVLKGLSTIVFGQTGKRPRWKITMYVKGDEIEVHKLSPMLSSEQQTHLTQFADNLLRIELRLSLNELINLDLRNGKQWKASTPFNIWSQYMRRIDMSAQLKLPDEITSHLRPTIASTYFRWKDGIDLRQVLKPWTFCNHRRQLLSYGIDIALPPDESEHTKNVVPLIRYLEAKPVAVPDWARDLRLVRP